MTVSELLRAGRLHDARTRLVDDVKASPGDVTSRTLLFQVLAFLGEWEKAERQLDILALQNAKAETAVQVYKNLVAAEQERMRVFTGERIPSFMTKEPPFLKNCFAFRESLTAGAIAEAVALFDEIESMAPVVTGSLDGVGFRGFGNTDASLSHFLEVFVHERYLWVPLAALRELSVPQPATLMDLLWIPASIVTWEGLTTNCYLPVVYPDSASHANELVWMGKMTDWRDLGGGLYRGLGQQVFRIGEEEKSLLELREISFTTLTTMVES